MRSRSPDSRAKASPAPDWSSPRPWDAALGRCLSARPREPLLSLQRLFLSPPPRKVPLRYLKWCFFPSSNCAFSTFNGTLTLLPVISVCSSQWYSFVLSNGTLLSFNSTHFPFHWYPHAPSNGTLIPPLRFFQQYPYSMVSYHPFQWYPIEVLQLPEDVWGNART